ncbi:MAG: hypothetical protein LBD21_03635 [Tannerellaceae bacterium]|jgi:predicted outer membrane repeat protein|nr:hypothetical protein [Tannerellaceae bacterium]
MKLRAFYIFICITGSLAVHAEKIRVTSTANAGAGSLREAIQTANATPAPDTILFRNVKHIVLTEALPAIAGSLVIDGEAGGVTIEAGTAGAPGIKRSMFSIARPEYGTPEYSVTFANLTLSGGNGNEGGAIRDERTNVADTLIVDHCTFSNNRATKGGAIWGRAATGIRHSTFTRNRADGESESNEGGAIYTHNRIVIDHCLFSENESKGSGGAIHFDVLDTNFGGYTDAVRNTDFVNNKAIGRGGAINTTHGQHATLHIENCKFWDNEVGMDSANGNYASGGAISSATTGFRVYNSLFANNKAIQGGAISAGSVKLVNSTFYGNKAEEGGGVYSGIYAHCEAIHCSFTANEAARSGGGIYGGRVTLINSILTGNKGRDAFDVFSTGFTLSMLYSIYHDVQSDFIRNYHSTVSTVEEVFGNPNPSPDDNLHVLKVKSGGPADRTGVLAGILSDVYYKEEGKWFLPNGNEETNPAYLENITPVVTDQLNQPRREGSITIGAWQLSGGSATLPVLKNEMKVTTTSNFIHIATAIPQTVDIYTPTGKLYAQVHVMGQKSVFAPSGFYIVTAASHSQKIVVR